VEHGSAVPLPDGEALGESDTVGDPDGEGGTLVESDGLGDTDGEGETLGESDAEGEGVSVGQAGVVGGALLVEVAEGLDEGRVGEDDGEALMEPVARTVGVGDTDGEGDAETLALGDFDAEGEADGTPEAAAEGLTPLGVLLPLLFGTETAPPLMKCSYQDFTRFR